MVESSSSSAVRGGRYTYIHDVNKGPSEAIDIHHILFPTKPRRRLHILLLPILCSLVALLLQDRSVPLVIGIFLLAALLERLLRLKRVEKESIIIFPAFGIQLETFYSSGRTARRFIPISKILKAILNECVTPVSCYWSLSLIIRGEEELLLVFRELRPPVSLLVPIWKALCAAIDENALNCMQNSDCDGGC